VVSRDRDRDSQEGEKERERERERETQTERDSTLNSLMRHFHVEGDGYPALQLCFFCLEEGLARKES